MKTIIIEQVESACASGLEKGVFSGCAVGINLGSGPSAVQIIRGFGKTSSNHSGILVDNSTFFDLASLTKPLCTVPCIARLIEIGAVDWNTPINSLDMCKNGLNKGDFQIKHLLAHCSGLPSYKPYFMQFSPIIDYQQKVRLLEMIYGEVCVYSPGEKNIYSDLDYILLGDLVEKYSGTGLDVFFQSEITSRLRLDKQLRFFPLGHREEYPSVAATEDCPWRGRVIQAEVHDEHSWIMGGVAGHAGLFGTVDGVLNICGEILNAWLGKNENSVFPSRIWAQLFTKTGESGTWYRGFDTPSPSGSSSGRYFSSRSAGHLGFTGTSFWIDPEKEIIVVLLTNRVHPSRENLQIKQFRPYFHDKVMELLVKQ